MKHILISRISSVILFFCFGDFMFSHGLTQG